MIQAGDLVRHKTLGYKVKKRKGFKRGQVSYPGYGLPTCPLLGVVVEVFENQRVFASGPMLKIFWFSGDVHNRIPEIRVATGDTLVLHKNLIKEVRMNDV
tara:strand:+ start:6390 stop:6689 length:300 start_codon:yes stop_codon:yes gene_type:complete